MIDPTKINMAVPIYGIDQIIGISTGTLSLSVPSAVPGYTTATTTFLHNFKDSCYFEGIFSQDGGVTWNDFGSQTPNLAAPNPQFQSVDVEAYTDNFNLNVQAVNYYDLAHGTGTARTANYKVYLMAKNSMNFPIQPIRTSQTLIYNSDTNYQKIFMSGTIPINVSGGTTGSTVPITHNLRYIPKIRSYFIDSSKRVFALNQWKPLVVAGAPNTVPAIEAHITSTTLTFHSDQSGFGAPGVSGNIDYRIYLDD